MCNYRDMECPQGGCNWRGAPSALGPHFGVMHYINTLCYQSAHKSVNGKLMPRAYYGGMVIDQIIEGGDLDMNARWLRAYQAGGHTFLQLIHTHSDKTLTMHVIFVGPESMRAKYKCTVSVSNDDYQSSFEGIPLNCPFTQKNLTKA